MNRAIPYDYNSRGPSDILKDWLRAHGTLTQRVATTIATTHLPACLGRQIREFDSDLTADLLHQIVSSHNTTVFRNSTLQWSQRWPDLHLRSTAINNMYEGILQSHLISPEIPAGYMMPCEYSDKDSDSIPELHSDEDTDTGNDDSSSD
jgi:hypothetical protein